MTTYKSPKIFNKAKVLNALLSKGYSAEDAQREADELEKEAREHGYEIKYKLED